MSVPTPHFLLFSDAARQERRSDWKFVLQAIDGSEKIEVEDAEPAMQGERLELLAVVRGLEALEQPSRVTLITPSAYVKRGLNQGLDEWRANDWQWECHGEMVPVKNYDLWRRVDRALEYHSVECRTWRLDAPHATTESAQREVPAETNAERISRRPARFRFKRFQLRVRRSWRNLAESVYLTIAQCGTALLPAPWL